MAYILAKDMFSASHENQMILMIIWYHYYFYAYFDLVVAYDMFVGL